MQKSRELLVKYLIANKVVEKAGDKVTDLALQEISKFYSLARTVILNAVKYAIPKNRPHTYIFQLPGNPIIEFVVRSSDPNIILASIAVEKLEPALDKAMDLAAALGAEKIQFMLTGDESWEFNYLLTDKGAVIGTEKSFSRRDQRFSLVLSNANVKNASNDGETPQDAQNDQDAPLDTFHF